LLNLEKDLSKEFTEGFKQLPLMILRNYAKSLLKVDQKEKSMAVYEWIIENPNVDQGDASYVELVA